MEILNPWVGLIIFPTWIDSNHSNVSLRILSLDSRLWPHRLFIKPRKIAFEWPKVSLHGSTWILSVYCQIFKCSNCGPMPSVDRGWEIKDNMFKVLQVLVVEDTGLVHRKVACEGFSMVVLLNIKINCYKSTTGKDWSIWFQPLWCWVDQIKSRRGEGDPLFHSFSPFFMDWWF